MRVNDKTVRFFYNGNETHCEVKQQGNEDAIAVGITTKFHKDVPNKRLARSVAFKRAMNQAKEHSTLTKAERTDIWNQFRTTIKQP